MTNTDNISFIRWLPTDEPAIETLRTIGANQSLRWFIDNESITRGIPADLFAYRAETNQWYIMDSRGKEI